MEYHLNPLRWSAISIFAIVILWNILTGYFGSSLLLFLVYLLLVVGFAASIRFTFEIQDDHLVYRVLLLKRAIIKKEIYPDEVEKIQFLRAGWVRKAAIIKINKGLDIRLVVLQPPKAYAHLLEFAEKQNISIVKTNDYLTLERKEARNQVED